MATSYVKPCMELKMRIEFWPIDKLVESARILRKNEKSVDRMARAIKEFGFRLPVLARASGEIVDGHLRVKAARALGIAEIPVIPCDDLDDAHIRALRLLLNRSATWASWDEEALSIEMAELSDLGLDLALTGFEPLEIEKFLKLAGDLDDADVDSAPALEDAPVSRAGDIWLPGSHRLLCGDATKPDSFAALLGGEPAACLWTDPPYGVKYKGRLRQRKKIDNDSLGSDDLYNFLLAAFKSCLPHLAPGASFYVSYASMSWGSFARALNDAGLHVLTTLVWVKNHFVISRNDYHQRHEPIFYGCKPGAPHAWHGDRKQQTVLEAFPAAIPGKDESGRDCWQVIDGGHIFRIMGDNVMVQELQGSVFYAPKPVASRLHPTMKPVALIEDMLKNSTLRGDLVLDPFAGSGSTLMACERLARRCAAIELDPLYVDCIVRRWQDATGLSALDASGASFDERAAARSAA